MIPNTKVYLNKISFHQMIVKHLNKNFKYGIHENTHFISLLSTDTNKDTFFQGNKQTGEKTRK
jgi:hypothetical protein